MNIACIALNSPRDCEWDGVSYPVVWCLHLLSLNGYAYTIITPSILWSDVVNQKDGKLFFSDFPADLTKRFFQFLSLLYFLISSLEFFQIIIYFDVSNHGTYGSSGWFTALPRCVEPALIFLIAIGCLWCGVRLQLYVMDVKFTGEVQVSALLKLNITMSVIVVSYLSRAVLVLGLFGPMPSQYRQALAVSYCEWLLGTRWLPFILCSFFLMSSMSQSGAHLARQAAEQEALLLAAHSNSNDNGGGGQSFASKRSSGDPTPSQGSSLSTSRPLLSWLLRSVSEEPLHHRLLEEARSTDSD